MYNPLSFGRWRPVLVRQPPDVQDVALTFDDGPTQDVTPTILRLLEAAGAKATFFLTGRRVVEQPRLVAETIAAGHAVYGHGWEHDNFEQTGAGAALEQMRRVEERLAAFRPTPSPYLLRLPYNAGYNRNWMHRAMRGLHPDVRFVFHSISTRDYTLASGCTDIAALQNRCRHIAGRIGARPDLPGSIILLHDKPFGAEDALSSRVAATLLPLLLDRIAARGLAAGLIRTTAAQPPLARFLLLHVAGAERD